MNGGFVDRVRLRELAEKATPGPWITERVFGGLVSVFAFLPEDRDDPTSVSVDLFEDPARADCDFVAAARLAVPELLDLLDEAVGLFETMAGGKVNGIMAMDMAVAFLDRYRENQ